MFVCVGLSLIETSLCAQALWVDASSSLGRIPPSSNPSREQVAAKPNLDIAAFHKPSDGTGQRGSKDRQRDKDTHKHTERERDSKNIQQ